MLKLLIVVALAQTGTSLPEARVLLPDRAVGPTAVTDKMLRPVRPPNCQNEAEVQKAVAQVRNGEQGDCFVRDLSAFRRYKG